MKTKPSTFAVGLLTAALATAAADAAPRFVAKGRAGFEYRSQKAKQTVETPRATPTEQPRRTTIAVMVDQKKKPFRLRATGRSGYRLRR